jgi:hypothetical protein
LRWVLPPLDGGLHCGSFPRSCAIAYFDRQEPVPSVRGSLQAALDGVIAEQDDRKKLAGA